MEDPLHTKLDAIHEEVKSLHTRHDNHDQQIGHAHHKLDRLRHGMALLFRGEVKEFLSWWQQR